MTGGIYQWRNTTTGDLYVGSTSNFHTRRQLHVSTLNRATHHNVILQHAWDKYGEGSFVFEILEIVADESKLFERETHYMNALKPKYNIAEVAESSRRGVILERDTKFKMSQAHRSITSDMSVHYTDMNQVHNRSLTDLEVQAIFKLAESMTNKEIATLFKVSPKVIYKVLARKSYKWVLMPQLGDTPNV